LVHERDVRLRQQYGVKRDRDDRGQEGARKGSAPFRRDENQPCRKDLHGTKWQADHTSFQGVRLKSFETHLQVSPLQLEQSSVTVASVVNVGIRSEELSGKLPANLNPICRNLSSRFFPLWNFPIIVVERGRHSCENGCRVNLRRDEACVLRSAVPERAVDEMGLAEFRGSEIASRERRAVKRDVAKESSPKDTACETTILER
jgi:hypothetical protein